ncbi:MAG: hypothetical protein HON65_01110 [Rhodospirillales bacterium]|nr:hypothetical protein [Rhodospirillales bacterium]
MTILGDSRAFDTYYLNDSYENYYGYDKTFPFILRREILSHGPNSLDIVHIPDHFRGGSIESNTLRVAMTNPAMVYLIDGIWETLLNKSHYIKYLLETVDKHSLRGDQTLQFEYSHEALIGLFKQNKLELSPSAYAHRIRSIASYFLRRRRHCCWMSLIMPDPSYKDRVHYAGDYRCSPVWNEALQAINESVGLSLSSIGAEYMDLQELMVDAGGENNVLIDQWHFTSEFHQILSDKMEVDIGTKHEGYSLDSRHVSNRHMLPNRKSGDTIIAWGDLANIWLTENTDLEIIGVADSIEDTMSSAAPIVVLACSQNSDRQAGIEKILPLIPQEKIILFPEEFSGINNPSRGH